jgi:hypothetical protein
MAADSDAGDTANDDEDYRIGEIVTWSGSRWRVDEFW